MSDITCYPEMNAKIKDLLRMPGGPGENTMEAICLYAAQRIEDLEADLKAGSKLCADRQDRINDVESLLSLAFNVLRHIKAGNGGSRRRTKVSGNLKVLLDEAVSRIERFFVGKEGWDGGEKPA